MSGGASPPDWARMGGFITETELGEPQRQAPQSTLTDEERARASRLKLRNALQGGHAEVALALLDGSDGGTLAQADLNEDGRLPLHIALDREPDALGAAGAEIEARKKAAIAERAAAAAAKKATAGAAAAALFSAATDTVLLERSEPSGRMALHHALACGRSSSLVAALMAEEPGATREADTVGGSLPLHLALAHGAAEATCFALFDAFRDAVKTADAAGRLPLAVANEHHAPSAVTWALLMAHPDGARARSHAGVVAAGAGVPGAPRAHVEPERPMR